MIADTHPWHGAAFWRSRDVSPTVFALAQTPKPRSTLWPGAEDGIRAPIGDETPLSESEVKYLLNSNVNTDAGA